jgi:UDP-3-O-[3-hydroxymyristoyl] glucosamine N-acyltransferase
MNMKKYEFIEEKSFYGIILKRIKRLSDGIVGGWIQSEDNLSHNGNCFIYDNAKVFGNAEVSGNAKVYDNAFVFGNAKVSGNAEVSGNAFVYDNARIYEGVIL